MIHSAIETRGGQPCLLLDGKAVPAAAYTTYFRERACYEDFVRAGYRIFFVNISMTLSPINSTTGFTPFDVGVFEDPTHPDYSEFEDEVEKILALCPDAYIFPRVYVSMPKWWCEAHPEETHDTPRGGRRELLFSDAFRRDGEQMLRTVVRHILSAPYASRVAGWQLCGGLTQEWFHHRDAKGGISPAAAPYYRRWVEAVFGEKDAVLPDRDCYMGGGKAICEDNNAKRYAEFSNLAVTETLDGFAKAVKEEVDYRQVVGAFYGYTLAVKEALRGTHGMRGVIDSPYLDFFSSPNCYSNARPFGIDWSDMMAMDSIKKRGKLCFMECDIRTFLTEGIQESRPGRYPLDIYPKTEKNKPSVWSGPPTAELSREALRKCFAHQITKGSGIWWFDMWGGWFADPMLMEALTDMRRIQEDLLVSTGVDFPLRVAVFADERAYANLYDDHGISRAVTENRIAMGNAGVPYAIYLAEEGEGVLCDLDAAIFLAPVPSEAGDRMMARCRERGIPYLTATAEHPVLSVGEIVSFLKAAGVRPYIETDDVLYVGNGFLGLHAKEAGEKKISLPTVCCVTPVFGTETPEAVTDTVILSMKKFETVLFRLTEL